MSKLHDIPWWVLIPLYIGVVYLIFALALCQCHAREYETYSGDRFVVVHEGQLGQYYADTVEVISKTERSGETELRLTNGSRRIVRTPDYTYKLEEK